MLYTEAAGAVALYGTVIAGSAFKADATFKDCPAGYEDARCRPAEKHGTRVSAHEAVCNFALLLPQFTMLKQAVLGSYYSRGRNADFALLDRSGVVCIGMAAAALAAWLYKKLMALWIDLPWVHAGTALLYHLAWGFEPKQGGKAAFASAVLDKSPEGTFGLRSPSHSRAMQAAITLFYTNTYVAIPLSVLHAKFICLLGGRRQLRGALRCFKAAEVLRRAQAIAEGTAHAAAEVAADQAARAAAAAMKRQREATLQRSYALLTEQKAQAESRKKSRFFGLGRFSIGTTRSRRLLLAAKCAALLNDDGDGGGDGDSDAGLCVHLRASLLGLLFIFECPLFTSHTVADP